MQLIPPAPLGPLGRLGLVVEEATARQSLMVAPAAGRIPPNIWAGLIVGGVLLYVLWRQWQDAHDHPTQGPPHVGAPALNNPRATPTHVDGVDLFPGSVTGTMAISGPDQSTLWTGSISWQWYDTTAFGCAKFGPRQTQSINITTYEPGKVLCGSLSRYQCGWSELAIQTYHPGHPEHDEFIASVDGNGAHLIGDVTWNINGVPGSLDAGTTPADQFENGAPSSDPVNVLKSAAIAVPENAIPAPKLRAPIGAYAPALPAGATAAVGQTAADIGVPAASIPAKASIATVGESTSALGQSQTAAEAAAIAAAAAALARGAAGVLTPAGTLAPPVPAAVPQTGLGTDYGGVVIGDGGTIVRGTIAAVASEVGRLEEKMEIIRQLPAVSADPLDLFQLLKQLWDYLQGEYPAGTYELRGPCEPVKSDGSAADPLVAPWASGNGTLGRIDQKIDALAELIQHHKSQRQPICGKALKAQGQGVTVHFEEI